MRCCCQVASVVSDSVRPYGLQPTRLLRPWDSPGKNIRVGCHFLLKCMKVESESEVIQSCLTLSDPMDCRPPGSSIHGIFWATVLEWGAIAFSREEYWGGSMDEKNNCRTPRPAASGSVQTAVLLSLVELAVSVIFTSCSPGLILYCFNHALVFKPEERKLGSGLYSQNKVDGGTMQGQGLGQTATFLLPKEGPWKPITTTAPCRL